MSTFSANDFRDPLLRVLGKMAEFSSGVPVQGTDTYDAVLDLMGITDPLAYGTNGASNQPWTYKWIQWANTNLRKAGLTENAKRGYWQLTPSGVQAALQVARLAGDNIVQTAGDTMQTATAAVDSTPLVVPATVVPQGRHYHDDPYIVSLAATKMACFGAYSPHASAVCRDCPMVTECRNKMAAHLSVLAVTLMTEDLKEAQAANTPRPPVNKAQEQADPAPTNKVKVAHIDFSTADVIKSIVESNCMACGGVIREKERCRWLDSVDGGDGGLFHLGCSGGE